MFKAGDEVRCITDKYIDIKRGLTDKIRYVDSRGWISFNVNATSTLNPNSFELVTQAMPTVTELKEGTYDYVMDDLNELHKCSDNKSIIEKTTDELTYIYSGTMYRIMACYKQNGYELELAWERKEEQTKEKRVIEILEHVRDKVVMIHNAQSKLELNKAINILKGE